MDNNGIDYTKILNRLEHLSLEELEIIEAKLLTESGRAEVLGMFHITEEQTQAQELKNKRLRILKHILENIV
jgi:hypothetical protein